MPIDSTHVAAHLLAVIAYVAVAIYVPSSFRSLIALHRLTYVFGSAFFICGGLTHLGLAIGEQESSLFLLADYLQVGCAFGFLIFLALDVQVALKNLRLAFRAIQVAFEPSGDHIIALITQALRRGH